MSGELATTTSRPGDGRSSGLDALRAVACLMVILFHLKTVAAVGFGPFDPIIEGGGTGVYVFFALSGYLLYRPFVPGNPNLASYAIKRAARIVPGYFVALIALVLLTGSSLPRDHPIPYLTITSSYSAELRKFLGSAWTLSAEVVFYVTLPLIALLARGRELRTIAWLGAASALAAIAARFLLVGDAQVLLGAYPFVFYAFVPGMALAVIEAAHPATFRRLAAWPWLVIGLGYVVAGTLFSLLPVAFASAIGAALLIGWLLQHPAPFGRALAFLGGMSYAAYLWHKDLIQTFGPVGAILALIGAAVSWALVERPVLDLAHRVARGFRAPIADRPAVETGLE